jgi:hypothetical protein
MTHDRVPSGLCEAARSFTVPQDMWYRVDLSVRADIEDEALREIQLRANTYAVVDAVEANRDTDAGDCRFTARTDAPNVTAALGSVLTVIAQVSGPIGLVEEGSLTRVIVEREDQA